MTTAVPTSAYARAQGHTLAADHERPAPPGAMGLGGIARLPLQTA